MMEKLIRLSRLLSGVGASIIDVAKIILLLQPQILILTIPMAMLLSILLVYGRLNADNELVIMRGSGMSFRNVSLPAVYLGIGCLILSLAMSFYISPKGSSMLRGKISDILTTRAPMTIEEGVFNTAFKDIVILVKEKPSPYKLSGIFIVDERKKDEQKVISASAGEIVPGSEGLSFSLSDGKIYITKKTIFTEIQFGNYYFRLNPSIESASKKNSELSPIELLREAKTAPDKKGQFLLEFHRRLSMPAICLILIMLGPSLSLIAGKSGRMGGLTIGLSVFAAYYTLLLYGENLARSGKLHNFLGSWMPFAILGAFSIYVFERVNKR
jgi:lipopolysaccharide export system permease protein